MSRITALPSIRWAEMCPRPTVSANWSRFLNNRGSTCLGGRGLWTIRAGNAILFVNLSMMNNLAFPVAPHDDMLDCMARILDPALGCCFSQRTARAGTTGRYAGLDGLRHFYRSWLMYGFEVDGGFTFYKFRGFDGTESLTDGPFALVLGNHAQGPDSCR